MTRGRSGFTLLEILAVLAGLGILSLGLIQGARFGLQSWNRQRRASDSVAELDATDVALRGLIERMEPGTSPDPPDIAGSRHILSFITKLPTSAAGMPMHRIAATLLADGQGRLILRWAPSPHARQILPVQPVETILLDGVDQLDISYRSSDPASSWQSEWYEPALPSLIRIHLGFAPNDLRRWPDLVAAPLREANRS